MSPRNPSRRGWMNEDGGGWVAHRLSLLTSPAWQRRPRPLVKIMDRLEIEHLRHAGNENGNLCVSYDQFVAFGVSRKAIKPALELGEALGLLEIVRVENWEGSHRPPNLFRLCYLPAKGKKAPTDEWRSHSPGRVAEIMRRSSEGGSK